MPRISRLKSALPDDDSYWCSYAAGKDEKDHLQEIELSIRELKLSHGQVSDDLQSEPPESSGYAGSIIGDTEANLQAVRDRLITVYRWGELEE